MIRIEFGIDENTDYIIDRIERSIAGNVQHAQKMLDAAIIHDTDPFVPMRQGTLASSAIRSTEIGSGIITYDTPYARHMYYGVHYKTGKPFKYSTLKHPLACKEWVKASKAVNLDKWKQIVKEALTDG